VSRGLEEFVREKRNDHKGQNVRYLSKSKIVEIREAGRNERPDQERVSRTRKGRVGEGEGDDQGWKVDAGT